MTKVAWLHLSDWHQGRRSQSRDVIRRELLRDIKRRADLSADLDNIDFIVFSGDLANTGTENEYHKASTDFIMPVRKAIGESVPLFAVPGNHDIQRDAIAGTPTDYAKIFASLSDEVVDVEQVEDCFSDPVVAELLSRPFQNFPTFCKSQGHEYQARKLHSVCRIQKSGINIDVICLNTAWHSACYELSHSRFDHVNRSFWDYGTLRLTESQIRAALDEAERSDLRIVVLHHPISWLGEREQAKVEQLLHTHADVILHGHEHRPRMQQFYSGYGEIVIIPAGACYYRRVADDPRYTNSYNFAVIDTDERVGTVYHRIWKEEEDLWSEDERFWEGGMSHFFLPRENKSRNRANSETPRNRALLLQGQKHYLQYLKWRMAIYFEVILNHEENVIDGEKFIAASCTYKFRLKRGNDEEFPVDVMVNERIVTHRNPNVRKNAVGQPKVDKRRSFLRRKDSRLNIYVGKIKVDQSETLRQ